MTNQYDYVSFHTHHDTARFREDLRSDPIGHFRTKCFAIKALWNGQADMPLALNTQDNTAYL